MFAAKDSDGKLVYAKLVSNLQSEYFCVDCNQQVKLIITKTNKYFKHQVKHEYNNNETTLHKKSKFMLKQDFEKIGYNTSTEVYTNRNQRIDLLVTKNNKKIAVEFQKSPITKEQLKKRVEGYNRSEYQNLWFLGMNYFSKKLTNRQLKFLNYHPLWKWYLLFCDAKKQRYLLVYEIEFFGVMNSQRYKVEFFSDLEQLRHFSPKKNKYFKIITKNFSDSFKKYCYSKKISYTPLTELQINLPPIMKNNLVWTLLNYQRNQNIDELCNIPVCIQIKPQLVASTMTEVSHKLDYLLTLIK